MKKIVTATFLCLLVSAHAFSQANNATLTGTVADATGAVLPGVTVSATNNATNIVTSAVTNEAGAYTILSLLPGTYTVSADLPGFQKQTYQNTVLGNAITVRLNFALQVASQAQSVEVTVAADTLLATSSPTQGLTLTEKRVSELPTVGNNVLDQLLILGGLDNFVATTGPGQSAFGREGTTLAGVSAQNTPVLRDGIMVQDTRWPTGINSATVMNQDLVGEVRLIVSPVDAELGRGNGAVQITTRSGTNQFHGAGVWNLQNSAMNANTWAQNRTNTPLNWLTDNQGTISGGGPIIKNRTFFYSLWDMNFNRQRAFTSASVLTPCARNGVFRYFDGWNNGAYGAATTATGATPTRAVVNLDGTPANITAQPNGQPSQLRYINVFGPVTFSGGAPNADCSNGTISGSPWDQFRTRPDPTGLISRTIALQPQPNDWNSLNNTGIDGLNTASYRYLRPFKGLDNLFSVGENTGNRKQINVKIDHNFNTNHRASVNYSYERVVSDDTLAALPGTWSNQNYHRPTVLTGSVVSTLTASIVNEAKFGYRVSGTNVVAPWDLPENDASINKYLPAQINGFRILPDISGGVGVCSPITGARPPGNCLGGNAAGANITATAQDRSPIWTYGDALSWSKGRHTIKFGGEIRFTSSETQGSSPGLGFFQNNKAPVVVVAGAAPGAQLAVAGPTAIANTNPAMTGIGTNDATKARNLLNFLAGSLTSINNQYFLTDPKATAFSDYRTSALVTNTVQQREFDLFFKDDYKVSKNLTLNLGLRYEWYGVPYSPFGLTAAAVGGGGAAFGISGRDFSGWMNPGARADQTVFQFVGPNSPNSNKLPFANNWKNFGPAVGFAYHVPWLGGKTTVRGGYQITYQGGSRFSALENALTQPPGRVYAGSFTGDSTNPYLDLTKLTAATVPTPLPPGTAPLTPIQITDRSQGANFFDPNYTSPYVQNLTLSITREVQQNLLVDVRYIGTLARRLYNTVNLNSANFLYNGLGTEFGKIRAGGESALLDQMMNGVNICTTGCTAGVQYGAIGSTVNGVLQTAAYQMRSSATFQGSLANGYWGSAPAGSTPVATLINMLDYTKAGCPAAGAAGNCNLPDVNNSVVRGAVMRLNGFPENFISTNPQFTTANYLSNMGNTNYHSLQAEVTLRPTHGFSGTANYTFSKNLGLPGTFTNPVDRHPDYTIVNTNHPHIFRSNANLDLPIGPGKLLFGGSSGVLARAIEGWRLGTIYTLSSGAWTSITANNGLYANGVPDVVDSALLQELLDSAGVKWGVKSATGVIEGDYFDRTQWIKVQDPQCFGVTSAQNLNGLQTGTAPRCTLQAIAKLVPDGTAGGIANIDGLGHSGKYVLQNPLPGKQGNLGQNVLRNLPVWRFDANISKSFKITESKSLQFRLDAFNVLNHAQPTLTGANNVSSLSINTSTVPFGQILQKNGQAPRYLQGQLRLQF